MSIVEMCYQLRSTKVEAQSVINWTVVTHPFTVLFLCPRGETTFSKLGVQFLGLGYYCPSPEKVRKVFPVFGAVCYPTIPPPKSCVKSWGIRPIFVGSGPPPWPPSGCAHALPSRNSSYYDSRSINKYQLCRWTRAMHRLSLCVDLYTAVDAECEKLHGKARQSQSRTSTVGSIVNSVRPTTVANHTEPPSPPCRAKLTTRCDDRRAVAKFSTPWVKKTRHQTLAHNFTKYRPIFKILSLLDSVGNL